MHYRLPMRWADLDQLNHVNNVVYLAYAAEARAALVEEVVIDPALVPVSVAIDFARPMPLSRRPVDVEQDLEGAVLTQDVTQEIDGERVVFARVVTHLGMPDGLGSAQVVGAETTFRGRTGDVAPSGHVDLVKVFEYFQESRILWMSRGEGSRRLGHLVVARLEVEYGRPVPWRREPWHMVVGVEKVGEKSFTLVSEWRDGDVVLARNRAILVVFDVESQSSRRMTDDERDFLTGP